MSEKILISKKRLDILKKELYQLINVDRLQNKTDLKNAREQGDLSENADYEAACERQVEIERRVNQIESLLKRAVINDETQVNHKEVNIGDRVKIFHSFFNKESTIQILSSFEVDPFNNIISSESPLAQALMHQKVGAEVTVVVNKKNFLVKILAIL